MTSLSLAPPSIRRHDLWVVSSHSSLKIGIAPSASAARGGHWLFICRSLWHGPDRDGKFEIDILTADPSQVRERHSSPNNP